MVVYKQIHSLKRINPLSQIQILALSNFRKRDQIIIKIHITFILINPSEYNIQFLLRKNSSPS